MTREPQPDELRRTACRLARIGADVARQMIGKVRAERKEDQTPVTQADHAAQEAMLFELGHLHADHAILVEETVARPDRHLAIDKSSYCWIIDPIDGTRNYARGVCVYAHSVAVLQEGRPIAAAIYDASSGIIYSASRGGGAFREHKPMTLSDRPIDPDTTIAISSFRKRPVPPGVRGWMDRFLYRNHGSLALHLAWTAAGFVDAAFAIESKLWDISAGALLIEEAGGKATDPKGASLWPRDVAAYRGEDIPILAGSPTIHADLVATL